MSTENKFHKLNLQLYPTGRAFVVSEDSDREKFDEGLMASEVRFYDESMSILDEILPDNDNFTAEMATAWEQRLGLITNSSVSLADRKAAIIRKMNHPGDIPARQSWDYLEQSLQLAGFNVYVYDNMNGTTISDILSPLSGTGQQGDGQQGDFQQGTTAGSLPTFFTCVTVGQQGDGQQGDFQQGGETTCYYNDKIINHIAWEDDLYFPISSWNSVFYIGGPTLGSFAEVPTARREEFRQIVLRIKPVHTVAMNLINYI